MYPEKDSGAGEGLKSESSEEWLRVFRLEKRRLGRDLKILCNSLKVCFSQVGGGELASCPRQQSTGQEEMVSNYARGGLDWI